MAVTETSAARHDASSSSNNFQRWFAHGAESNAWSLVLLASAPATVCILGVWAALTVFASSLPRGDIAVGEGEARDVLDPRFAPFPISDAQQLYLAFSTAVFARAGIVVPLVCFYLVGCRLPSQRVARIVDGLVALLLALTFVLIGALVLSQRSAAQQITLMRARDASVDAQFNAFYCTARVGSLCTDSSVSVATLQSVFAGDFSITDSDTMNRVVRGCRHVFTQLESSSSVDSHSPARRAAFLATCATSDAMDRWCGELVLMRAAGVDAASVHVGATRALASPAHAHSARFRDFDVAWTSRLEFDAIMLGVVSCLLLLFCGSWTRMLVADKRPSLSSAVSEKLE